MKRVLFLEEDDFKGDVRSLSNLKKSVKELEPMFDDIFYDDDGTITCFKVRTNRVGKYSIDEIKKYLFNGKGDQDKISV